MNDFLLYLATLFICALIAIPCSFLAFDIIKSDRVEKELLQLQIEEKRLNIELLKKGVCVNGL